MDSTGIMPSEKSQVYSVWFYLHQVHKQTKLIYDIRSQQSGYPLWVTLVAKRGF